jgi:hypothetical protein
MKFKVGDVAIIEDAENFPGHAVGDKVRIKASNMHPLGGNLVYMEDPRGIWNCDAEFRAQGLRKVGFQRVSKWPTDQVW